MITSNSSITQYVGMPRRISDYAFAVNTYIIACDENIAPALSLLEFDCVLEPIVVAPATWYAWAHVINYQCGWGVVLYELTVFRIRWLSKCSTYINSSDYLLRIDERGSNMLPVWRLSVCDSTNVKEVQKQRYQQFSITKKTEPRKQLVGFSTDKVPRLNRI